MENKIILKKDIILSLFAYFFLSFSLEYLHVLRNRHTFAPKLSLSLSLPNLPTVHSGISHSINKRYTLTGLLTGALLQTNKFVLFTFNNSHISVPVKPCQCPFLQTYLQARPSVFVCLVDPPFTLDISLTYMVFVTSVTR